MVAPAEGSETTVTIKPGEWNTRWPWVHFCIPDHPNMPRRIKIKFRFPVFSLWGVDRKGKKSDDIATPT